MSIESWPLDWRTFKRLWWIQLGICIALFCIWFYLRARAYLAAPPPHDELYAQTWSFQLLVGALYLIGSIPLFGFLLLLEAGLFAGLLRVLRRH